MQGFLRLCFLTFELHFTYDSTRIADESSLLINEKKKLFSYRDIKKVYTIILFEKSTKEFHEFPNIYVHHSEQKSDTGLKLELLQDYTFIT